MFIFIFWCVYLSHSSAKNDAEHEVYQGKYKRNDLDRNVFF